MTVIETSRLKLRRLALPDGAFILELLNEPGFLRYIGDKGVRSVADACVYLEKGPLDSYEKNGFGLYAVCLRDDKPIGMCGLVKRDGLDAPDVGFAFLSRFWSQGYAVESAAAVLEYGRRSLKLGRIVAITSLDNAGSIAVLQKIGLKLERLVNLAEDSKPLNLFS